MIFFPWLCIKFIIFYGHPSVHPSIILRWKLVSLFIFAQRAYAWNNTNKNNNRTERKIMGHKIVLDFKSHHISSFKKKFKRGLIQNKKKIVIEVINQSIELLSNINVSLKSCYAADFSIISMIYPNFVLLLLLQKQINYKL